MTDCQGKNIGKNKAGVLRPRRGGMMIAPDVRVSVSTGSRKMQWKENERFAPRRGV